jgi:hypothetical protein
MEKSINKVILGISGIGLLLIALSCTTVSNKNEQMKTTFSKGSYAYDLNFLKNKGIGFIELKDTASQASLIVVPEWQGRIMTSTSNSPEGESYGWINYNLIESGEINNQFNPFGGEERLWLGPEGGPFSIYFDKGDEQIVDNWRVPKELDTEAFELINQTENSVHFKKEFQLSNASGTLLDIKLDREVNILNRKSAESYLGLDLDESLSLVSYQSSNIITNNGESAWTETSGAPSIWVLCMFNPSEKGLVFIPFQKGDEKELGPIVNDNYFGKVPEERLIVDDGVIFFQTDGKYRSKIGVLPKRAYSICGSYDPVKQTLTILWYSSLNTSMLYVNSMWGDQDNPFSGDAINSYNDGPLADGSIFGPFYEIESSSPAAFLAQGENMTHVQRIFHISGEEEKLNSITMELFGISIEKIKSIF